MPSTWLINDASPESLGLEVVGGVFRSGSASSVRLRRVRAFDAAEILSGYGGAVTIKRNGTKFFVGKIRAIPKSSDGPDEAQEYIVEDAWADMERTVYQEAWSYKYLVAGVATTGTFFMPRVFLGMSSAGSALTVGGQISEAISYAVTAGIPIAAGSFPTGMTLWPSEVNCISIAEMVRNSLRYYPSWLPWINHTTATPTFNVTPRASASVMNVAVTDCDSLDVQEINDRLPDCVRVVYVTANDLNGEVSRTYAADKYPTGGSDTGPGTLTTTVDLQGMRSTIQKQQVQVREIPTDSASDTEKKAWLKLKFPALRALADTDFDVAAWTVEVAEETETAPDPINPRATPLRGPDVTLTTTDIPNELVKGSIHEWMRKKVGQVRISWFHGVTGTATAAEEKLLKRVPMGVTVTATDAVTKIYKSLSSYVDASSAPAGVAQAYYENLQAACRYEGSITLNTEGLAAPWHGKVINLTGGVSGWSTMAAPIHSITWDAQTELATIYFGPTPDYGFQDFLEYLDLLRRRPVNWISGIERTSAESGNELDGSSAGDNVGSFDTPREIPEVPTEAEWPFRLSTSKDGSTLKWRVSSKHSSITDGTNGSAIDLSSVGFDTDNTITASKWIVLQANVSSSFVLSSWTLSAVDSADANEVGMDSSTPPIQNKLRLLIGKVTVSGGEATASQAVFTPQRITHDLPNGQAVKVFDSAPTHKDDL